MIQLTEAQARTMDDKLAKIETEVRGDARRVNQIRQIRLMLNKSRRRARRKEEQRKN